MKQFVGLPLTTVPNADAGVAVSVAARYQAGWFRLNRRHVAAAAEPRRAEQHNDGDRQQQADDAEHDAAAAAAGDGADGDQVTRMVFPSSNIAAFVATVSRTLMPHLCISYKSELFLAGEGEWN